MNIPLILKFNPGLAAVIGSVFVYHSTLLAAPFVYSPGDLVLAFRKVGGASDLVVNIGKATNFNNLPLGTTVTVSNLSVSQLNTAFANLNSVSWSIAAANRPPLVPGFPLQTLWVTAPRLEPDTASAPWLRKGTYVQGNAAAQIDAIGFNAAAASSSQSSNANNTVVGVVIPSSSDYAVKPLIGEGGNYQGTFQGTVESTTAANFTADAGNVSRADLYELLPGNFESGTLDTPGRYLGYFEFKPDGTLTFNTSESPPPRPAIISVVRKGDLTTISFSTVAGAHYRLRYTEPDGLATPISTWSTGAATVGDGGVKGLEHSSNSENLIFAVDAQR
jgi:hypothetical protein